MNDATDFLLAVHQHVPTPGDTEASLARLQATAAEAASEGAHLLLVPEASLTGYNISPSTAQQVAVARDSDITNRLQTLCQSAGIALAYGYIERDGQALYNAVSVIDAAGHNVAHYRKTHLWGDLDRTLFTAGDAFSPVFVLNGWHIGLLICYDIEFPEPVRHLALQGAELILTPTALMTPWTFVADDVTRVRAVENQLYVAYANYCGSEGDIDYVGRSCIAGPDATELARAGATPELLLGRLSKARLEQMREHLPYYRDRRPELYRLQ